MIAASLYSYYIIVGMQSQSNKLELFEQNNDVQNMNEEGDRERGGREKGVYVRETDGYIDKI